jgi:hypothetical protein
MDIANKISLQETFTGLAGHVVACLAVAESLPSIALLASELITLHINKTVFNLIISFMR